MKKQSFSHARVQLVKFLYQCEIRGHQMPDSQAFDDFLAHFSFEERLTDQALNWAKDIVSQIFPKISELDSKIESASDKWSLSRMNALDKIILRLSCFELLYSGTPSKVVLNEAVELAKMFGTSDSSRFVNGVLDALDKKIRPKSESLEKDKV